jgi:hypothetical protein
MAGPCRFCGDWYGFWWGRPGGLGLVVGGSWAGSWSEVGR